MRLRPEIRKWHCCVCLQAIVERHLQQQLRPEFEPGHGIYQQALTSALENAFTARSNADATLARQQWMPSEFFDEIAALARWVKRLAEFHAVRPATDVFHSGKTRSGRASQRSWAPARMASGEQLPLVLPELCFRWDTRSAARDILQHAECRIRQLLVAELRAALDALPRSWRLLAAKS